MVKLRIFVCLSNIFFLFISCPSFIKINNERKKIMSSFWHSGGLQVAKEISFSKKKKKKRKDIRMLDAI